MPQLVTPRPPAPPLGPAAAFQAQHWILAVMAQCMVIADGWWTVPEIKEVAEGCEWLGRTEAERRVPKD